MSPFFSVYLTAPDEAVARRLARLAVERRLAACANVLGAVTSVFRWEGQIQEEPEVALLLKTTRARVEDLVAALVEAHPYELPAIACLPAEGQAELVDWLNAETAPL